MRNLRHDLERVAKMGGVRRFFAGLNPEQITLEIGRTEARYKATTDAMRASESEYAETEQTIQNLESELRTLALRIQDLPSMAQ